MRLKKKMIITAAALLLTALQGVCAMAAQPDASVMNERIYVRGQLTGSEFSYGDSLTVLLQNESDNSIAYANEVDVNADGSYSIAFPFADYSADNHKLTVTAGEVNVSDSTVYAGRFDDIVKTEFVKTEDGKHIKIFAEISNPYLLEQGYTLIAAAYTGNTLKETVLSEPQELSASENVNTHLVSLAIEDVDRIKLMIFENMVSIEPLCQDFPVEDISGLPVESNIFYNRYEVEDAKDMVAFSRVEEYANNYLKKGEGKGYFAVEGIDLTKVKSCIINAGTNIYGKTLEVRVGSRDGEKIGEVELQLTKQTNIYTLSDFDLKTVDDKNATLYFVDNSEESGIGVDFVMFTNDVSSQCSGARAAEYVNSDSADVKYNGNVTDAKNTLYYNGDAKSVSADGSVKYEFYGTGIDIIADITAGDCEVDVYLDGILDKTINLKNRLNEGQAAYARPIYTKTGLKRWGHTIEIKTKNDGFTLDAFKVYTRPIRIVCAGDSITDGYRITNTSSNKTGVDLSWPHRLNELLGNGYIVFNCGRRSATTTSYVDSSEYPFRTARLEDADIVSIMLGFNDVRPTRPTEAYSDMSKFKDRYVNVANLITEQYTSVPRIYIAQVPFFNSTYENNVTSNSDKKQLFTFLKELSAENNWPFIDFYTYMKPYQNRTDLSADGVHPTTVNTIWMMAEAIYGQLPCSELSDSAEIEERIEMRSKGIDPDSTNAE